MLLLRVSSQSRSFSRYSGVLRQNASILNLDSPKKRFQNQTSSKEGSNSNSRRKSKSIQWSLGSIGLLSIPVFAFSLGCWQVYRLQWKLDLLESLKSRLSESAVEFPVNDISCLDDMEYRRVGLQGEFLHQREFTITPRGRFDEGYKQNDVGSLLSDNNMSSHGAHVITPFKIKGSNLVIMVNRGWVPGNQIPRESRIKNEPRGTVTLEAIVRKSEKRPQFVGKNVPEQGVWFYKDFEQMARQYGTAPIYVEAVYESSQPGGPIGGQTNVSVRNEHLSYLITWYSLTAVTIAMWLVRFRK